MQIITNAENIEDYVICTGQANSLENFINRVFSTFELEWKDHIIIDKNLFRSNEVLKSYGDPKPLFNKLGWRTKVNFNNLVNKMISGL